MKLLSLSLITIFILTASLTLLAAPQKDKERPKEQEGHKVDSGSFGIFMNGHRVGTETFSIIQTGSGSEISSEFRTVNDSAEAVQTSEMDLSVSGDIRRYEWTEVKPGKAHAVVAPNEEFLMEKWSASSEDKVHDQPYLLTHSTSILDDYFFVHREVLLWKFLAAACKRQNEQLQCPVKQRTQFSTLTPHQHTSASLSAEYLGREKIAYKGTPQEFDKVEFKTESGSWLLWFDEQFKVVRMVVEGDNTEVLRD